MTDKTISSIKTQESLHDFKIWMGFDVCMEFLRPLRLEFWKDSEFSNFKSQSPFQYQADALVGLSTFLLHPSWRGPHLPVQKSKFPLEVWHLLEPHCELYRRSQERIRSFAAPQPNSFDSHEKSLIEVIFSACQSWGIDFMDFHELTTVIDRIEGKLGRPLLYNFDLKFSPGTTSTLQILHSLLFNLRSLMATDYNAYVRDPTHEALKVDSLTDYLPSNEYIVNDALLYREYQTLKDQFPAEARTQMDQSFKKFSHNGMCLIQNLPESFIAGMTPELLEESLYLVQMDWLLGTPAGLLYRIREEACGLIEGYSRIFWPDITEKTMAMTDRLSLQFELTSKSLNLSSAVA